MRFDMPAILPELGEARPSTRTDAILSGAAVPPGVSADADAQEPSGKARFIEALEVPRNARRGFGFGFVFTVAVFVFFIIIPGTNRSQLYYLGLAFVLAVGIGGIVTTVLTARTAYRLSKEL